MQIRPINDAFTYDELNRIQSSTLFEETYTYDNRGNRSTLQSTQSFDMPENVGFAYDEWDRLTQVTKQDGTIVEYRYNGDNLLVERRINGETTRYYYDGQQVVAEGIVQPNGTVAEKVSYLRGYGLAMLEEADGTKGYYLHNGHGDVVGIVDADGDMLNSYTYDIWGKPLSKEEALSNSFLYAGELWDDATKLQYLRARWYDPNIGRFINEDTYEGELNNPLTLNLYTYVHNNPLRYIDPSGNKAWLIHGTFSNPTKSWGEDDTFDKYVEGLFNETSERLEWSGSNRTDARAGAAKNIFDKVYAWHLENPNDPIRLVGHSHGVNVAIMVANLLSEKGIAVETLITIATPVRGYKLDKNTSVVKHIHLYNLTDQIQANGGSMWTFGATRSRKFKSAENVRVKDAEKPGVFSPNGGPIDSHSSMHSNVDVWKKYIEPILKKK